MKRLRSTKEVSCSNCFKSYEKRLDTLSTWNGMCRKCTNVFVIENKIKGIERVPKPQCSSCGKKSKYIKSSGLCWECYKLSRPKGEDHHNWKGGITSENTYQRSKFLKYTQPKVFKRDNYTCSLCFIRGGYLQVDHINEWAKYPDLRFDMANCRTLCMACHYKITFNKDIPQGIIWGHNLSQREKELS